MIGFLEDPIKDPAPDNWTPPATPRAVRTAERARNVHHQHRSLAAPLPGPAPWTGVSDARQLTWTATFCSGWPGSLSLPCHCPSDASGLHAPDNSPCPLLGTQVRTKLLLGLSERSCPLHGWSDAQARLQSVLGTADSTHCVPGIKKERREGGDGGGEALEFFQK